MAEPITMRPHQSPISGLKLHAPTGVSKSVHLGHQGMEFRYRLCNQLNRFLHIVAANNMATQRTLFPMKNDAGRYPMSSEIKAWLIERFGPCYGKHENVYGVHSYQTTPYRWMHFDGNYEIRFDRKEDAVAFVDHFGSIVRTES